MLHTLINNFFPQIVITTLFVLLFVGVVGFIWVIAQAGNIAENIHRQVSRETHSLERLILGLIKDLELQETRYNKRFSNIECTTANINNILEMLNDKLNESKGEQLSSEDLQVAVKELSILIESARTNLAKNIYSAHEAVNKLDKSVASTFIKTLTGAGKS